MSAASSQRHSAAGNHQRGRGRAASAGWAYGRVGEDVVGDAGLAHAPVEALSAVRTVVFGHLAETIQERAPVRTHLAGAIQKFVVASRWRPGR